MPKKFIDVDGLVDEWTDVSADQQPIAFEGWRRYRQDELGAHFVPKAYTVPTMMPPATRADSEAYKAVIRQIRSSNGWKGDGAKIP